MGVEVNYGDGPISSVNGSEEWQCDCMISPKCNEAWEGAAGFANARAVSSGMRYAGQQSVMAFFDLLECVGIVIAG